MNRQGTHD